ncbi:hypothetical protein A9995_14815 [Erythrobacter sp. QSSC1-22B]|nr:hypothetical protein A9995_14815 [Erythrobacter sp. QSSC1-22B]
MKASGAKSQAEILAAIRRMVARWTIARPLDRYHIPLNFKQANYFVQRVVGRPAAATLDPRESFPADTNQLSHLRLAKSPIAAVSQTMASNNNA